MDRFSAPGSKLAPAYNSAGNFTFPDFSQGDDYEPSGVYQVRKEDPAFADDFTKVVGSHTLKFGAFTQNTSNYQGGGQQVNGIFSYGGQNPNPFLGYIVGSPNNPTANFVMGSVTGYNEANKSPNSDMAYQIVSFYGNDNWKVNNKLSMDIGFRLEHVGHWYDRTGNGMAVFYAEPRCLGLLLRQSRAWFLLARHQLRYTAERSAEPPCVPGSAFRFGL